ncbi:MAG: hypothetical protein WBB22_05280 [Anaerolineae bacterium]
MNLTQASRLELKDLDWFIDLSGLVGFKQYGLSSIRARQDEALTERLRQQALERISDPKQIEVTDDNYFLGSVDYMVRQTENGELGYTILETNGGSSRGLTLLAPGDVERLMTAFVEMLRFVDHESPLIVIGHPDGDVLLTEKFLIAHRLKEALEARGSGRRVRILPIRSFGQHSRTEDPLIVISPHSQSALALRAQNDEVYLLDRRVQAIIGDGVVARHHELGRRRTDVVLANWIFPITSDKYNTYQAVESARPSLEPHGVCPLVFWRAWDRQDLERICEAKRSELDGLIIKPYGGSGGAGVLPVTEDTSVGEAVEESLNEFHTKYGDRIDPFPYTVCEKLRPWKATWRGQPHNFDIRIYVARERDNLAPAGCLFRIAPKPDTGTYSKDSLIVNLSGYGGLAVERGLGLTKESLEMVHLTEEDIVRIFAASTLLMAAIAQQPFDWSQRARPAVP